MAFALDGLGGTAHQTKPLGVINMRKNGQHIHLAPFGFVVQMKNLEVANLHYLIVVNCKIKWYLNKWENINSGKMKMKVPNDSEKSEGSEKMEKKWKMKWKRKKFMICKITNQ